MKLKKFFKKNIDKPISDEVQYVEISQSPYIRKENDPKLIAFYLPQYHSIKENDDIHGKGFTDWLNVAKATSLCNGHRQPQLPIDVGFYDLSHVDVMYRQVELAKKYGIYGFCFHYYWFSGRRVLEKPIMNFLHNKDLELPFCLCWANENWSKLWDGGDKEVFIKQDLNDNDFQGFFDDILPFFSDERYIKINNKPLLIIYKTHTLNEDVLKRFIVFMNETAKKHGFDGVYLLTTNSWEYDASLAKKAEELGFDATMEFPPHGLIFGKGKQIEDYQIKTDIYDKKFQGMVIDMNKIINEKIYKTNAKFKGLFPSWDNSPRKCHTGCFLMQTSINDYKKWLEDTIYDTKMNNSKDEQFIFINAWNEWAEGAHLEPDHKTGYAYLQATKDVLENLE